MKHIDTAFEWHGGKHSALYLFASTRQLWSEEHRLLAREEVHFSIAWHGNHREQEDGDLTKLRELHKILRTLPIGEEIPC